MRATRPLPYLQSKPFWTAVLLAMLLIVLFAPVVSSLLGQWLEDENYRHGLLVPLISLFIFYQRREVLAGALSPRGAAAGWWVCLAAGILLIGGTAAGELMTQRLAIPTMLIGLALVFCGGRFVRAAAFPLLFLYMMVPLPYIIYYKIAFPLQLVSAKLSGALLDLLGVSVIRHGNVLLLPNYSLEVVAACSGLRSLMTMITLALVIGAVAELPTRRRWLLVAVAVPAAVLANMARLMITALGAYLLSPAFADGFLHTFSGLVVFVTGLLVLLAAYFVLRRET